MSGSSKWHPNRWTSQQRLNLALALMCWLSRPLRQMFTHPGSAGIREVNSPVDILAGWTIIWLWAGLGGSPNMQWILYASIICQIDHWWRTKRTNGETSRFFGRPQLNRSFETDKAAWRATNLMWIAIGFVLREEDIDVVMANYFIASGICNALFLSFAQHQLEREDDAVYDAYVQQRARVSRLRDRM